MPIVGFIINNVDGNRTKEPMVGNIKINSSVKVSGVEEKKIQFFSDKPLLSVSYEFKTDFEKLGNISLTGEVYYMSDDTKKILKDYQKDKKLTKGVDIEVQNFLFRKCLTVINSISENMELPPPINFPIIVPKEEEDSKPKYIG